MAVGAAPETLSDKVKPYMRVATIAAALAGGYYLYKKYASEDDSLDEESEDV